MALDRSTQSREFAPFATPTSGLVRVEPDNLDHALVLYRLLEQRTAEQSISHRELPSFGRHVEFVRSRPYLVWYLVRVAGVDVGSIYLTRQLEIGLFIDADHQRKGYGGTAVRELMETHRSMDLPFLANINPNNAASIAFWKSLGFELRQVTYAKSITPR